MYLVPRFRCVRYRVALSACADAYRVILGRTEEVLKSAQSAERAQELKLPFSASSTKEEGQKTGDAKPKSGAEKLAAPALGVVVGTGVAIAHAKDVDAGGILLGLSSGLLTSS